MLYLSSYLSIKFNMWLNGFIVVILKYSILAYNLDVNNGKVFNVPTITNYKRGSYFGFSTALYTNGEDSILLVGAPRANTSTLQSVIEPGTVYQCPINRTCKEWIIDKTNNNYILNGYIKQNKNNAWIGTTIAVENTTNPRVVVCGSRWKSDWYLNGICYWTVVNNIKSFEKEAENKILLFKDTSQQIIHKPYGSIFGFGMSQVGFSLNMKTTELGWNLILGAPGVLHWKGATLLFTKLGNSETQTIIPWLEDQMSLYYYDLFGYATTSGYYFNKEELWVASGAPKAANVHGNVIIYTFLNYRNKTLTIKEVLTGEQHGEYFGAALTSCDLNGDGKDELIVGAPQWTKDTDEGRVYVFIALHNANFERQFFDGEVPGSRFGSAVTCLGDIDYDGYNDIAVGAPYEDQTGAIYIFNGNSNGLPKHYSQKIIGTQFGEHIRGFGISIAEPRDMNGDTYPDIAVGAYLSDQAILIKSKPVVTITTSLIYDEKNKLLRNSTSFIIDVCTSYTGINVPESLETVGILKIDQMYQRAFYDLEESNVYKFSHILHKSKMLCIPLEIHLKENIQNVINPLEISVSVILKEESQLKNKEMEPNLFCTSCATINKFFSKTEDAIKLPFAVDCGDDNICISDVRMTLSTDLMSDNRYIMGSRSTIKFIINASNYGEPAYQAKIHIYIPKILSLASVPPSCMESSRIDDILEVICDIGNPFKTNETLMLELDMSKVWFDVGHAKIWTNFTTQSEEKTLSKNMHNLTIHFDIDIDIVIAGKAQEDLYSYFLKDGENQLNSLQFRHIYEIQKFGASPIEKAILVISIPTYWKHSTGDIEIININQTIAYMDGQKFYCTHSNSTSSIPLINKPKVNSTDSKLNTKENFTIESNVSINLPPSNRSVYINCTNTNIKCTYIECELGPFVNPSSVAKLSLILDLDILNLKSNIVEGKDIIFFLSDGSVYILQPSNVTQKSGHKPDSTMVATMFLGSPVAEKVATWVQILSIVLGILLLILLVLGLIKIGFFNRKKKEELKALMSEADQKQSITLETTSSRECLDQE